MRISLSLLVFAIATLSLHADNWPAWRGPHGNGMCDEKNLPTKWSPTENVVWKVALPDEGNSTPIVWKDRVFLTQATEKGKKRSTICFNTKDGSKRWEQKIEYTENEPTHGTNPHCAASAVTDGEIVVVSHGSAGVFCYDLDGKELWKRDLGKCIHVWGFAASPVIWQDRVFLNFGPGERTFLLAMNKKDGTDIWKKDIPGGKSGIGKGAEWLGSWSTPTVTKIRGRDEVVVSWPEAVRSYDPKTGDELWSCSGLTKLVYTSAQVSDDYVVAMSGYGGAAIGLKTGGKGDLTESNRLWHHAKGNPQRIGSGIIIGEHLYMVNAPGSAMCMEIKTGKKLWEEPRASSEQWSSLVHADGKMYFTTRGGETVVFAAQPKAYEEIARNKLGETANASIAVADGRLFIRTYKNLWCIGK